MKGLVIFNFGSQFFIKAIDSTQTLRCWQQRWDPTRYLEMSFIIALSEG